MSQAAVQIQSPFLFLQERQAEYYEKQDRKQELYQNACSLLKTILKRPKDCSALLDLIESIEDVVPALQEMRAEIVQIMDDYPAPGEDEEYKDGWCL
jgi:hypothetical protein